MHVSGKYLSTIVLLSVVTTGCANHFKVVAGTSNKDLGFKYSIPAPYLVITNTKLTVPSTTSTPVPTTDRNTGGGANHAEGRHEIEAREADPSNTPPPVTATIVYLPSDESYFVKTKTGMFGTFKGSLTLQNGWMLTAVNQEFDTKGTETLTAVAGVLGSIIKGGAALAERSVINAKGPFLCLYKIDVKASNLSLQAVSAGDADQAKSCQALIGTAAH